MPRYSKQIQNFLAAVGADPTLHVQMVPKSDSCARPGDVLFFRYKLGEGGGSRRERLFMVVEPITKEPRTGNLLLVGFKVPDDGIYTPESLEDLYKNKDLPEDGYRTYRLNRTWGPLRRIRKE
tara:strand:- start:1717 stop:2085 length:369 start_codon:yes stop_codon:yes gene_type:complete